MTIRSRASPDLTASSGPPFAPPPPGAIRDRFANLTRGAAVRDPHQFPYSAPVRSFLGQELPDTPQEPATTVLPPVEPTGSGDPAEESGGRADSLFGQS